MQRQMDDLGVCVVSSANREARGQSHGGRLSGGVRDLGQTIIINRRACSEPIPTTIEMTSDRTDESTGAAR